jgi:pyruvate,water dikinase
MIYSEGAEKTKNVPTSKAERAAWVLERRRDPDACPLGLHHRGTLRLPDGHGMGQGRLYRRPVHRSGASRNRAGARDQSSFKSYEIKKKGKVLTKGLSIGGSVVAGHLCLIEDVADIDKFVDGSILVTGTTDPDWVPIMKRAAGIITDHGGRTSHAAIVSRELGVPAIVGTGDATHVLHSEQEVTLSCAEGDEGFVYEGFAEYEEKTESLADIPETEDPGHAQPRQSGLGLPLVADPVRRRRPGAHGIRHQQPDPGPPDGADPFRSGHRRGDARKDRGPDARL